MINLQTIVQKKDFQALRKADFCQTHSLFIIVTNCQDEVTYEHKVPLFGFSISKKHGIAVTRNLLKRRVKAIIRNVLKHNYDILVANMHYLIIPKVGAIVVPYHELESALIHTLQGIKRKYSKSRSNDRLELNS